MIETLQIWLKVLDQLLKGYNGNGIKFIGLPEILEKGFRHTEIFSLLRNGLQNVNYSILADRTDTHYDRLSASSWLPSVRLSVTLLRIVALGVGIEG